MRVLVIEDEMHARQSLIQHLKQIQPDIEIQAEIDSVEAAVNWLGQNQTDLIFLDIHLADDLSFKIFDQIEVNTPIIFTTAYDQYALQAFKVNSIDYLLKPIDQEELSLALEKFQSIRSAAAINYEKLKQVLDGPAGKTYQQRFIVSRRDRIMSVKVEDIAYFEGEDRYVYLTKKDGSRYIIDYKLSDLEEQLDPTLFFRLNRSFIAGFDAIDRITSMSKSRIKVDLKPEAKRDIIVSSANSRSFKMWLNQ